MGCDDVGCRRDQCNGSELFLFPGQLGKHRGVTHVVGRVRDQERVAVLGCAGHQGIGDIAAGAPLIFDHDLLAKKFAERFADEPGRCINHAPRRIWNDQSDRLGRKTLCGCRRIQAANQHAGEGAV